MKSVKKKTERIQRNFFAEKRDGGKPAKEKQAHSKTADEKQATEKTKTGAKAGERQTLRAEEKIYRAIVIGGGAAGLFFAAKYGNKDVLVLEKGERAGRKLSATGGGWGNVTNVNAGAENGDEGYFSCFPEGKDKIREALKEFSSADLRHFLLSLGCITFSDERGRVYPASRQASSLTDCLRAEAARRGAHIFTGENVENIGLLSEKEATNGAKITVQTQNAVYFSENVLISTGGKAAKNFGSDGAGYAFARSFGHTITPLFPVLVQLKCAEKENRTLKGIRVFDVGIALFDREREIVRLRGDILFTEFGVSGDGAFRISSYIPYKQAAGGSEEDVFAHGRLSLSVNFLPDVSAEELKKVLAEKRRKYKDMPVEELLFGIVNNQAGRRIAAKAAEKYGDLSQKEAEEVAAALAETAKDYRMTITGTLGFDNAQATRGGVPLSETNGDFSSVFAPNVYFAGEILDCDGACGGYNLQWAYSSACTAGKSMFGNDGEKQ